MLGGLRCHHTLEVVLNQVDRLVPRKKNCAWRPPCEIRYCQGRKGFMSGTLDESIKRVNWDIKDSRAVTATIHNEPLDYVVKPNHNRMIDNQQSISKVPSRKAQALFPHQLPLMHLPEPFHLLRLLLPFFLSFPLPVFLLFIVGRHTTPRQTSAQKLWGDWWGGRLFSKGFAFPEDRRLLA